MKITFKTGLRFNILVYLGFMMLTAVALTSIVLLKITVISMTEQEARRALGATEAIATSIGVLLRENEPISSHRTSIIKALASVIGEDLGLEKVVIVGADKQVISIYSRSDDKTFDLPSVRSAIGSGEPVVDIKKSGLGLWGSGVREIVISAPVKRNRWTFAGVQAYFPVEDIDHNIRVTQQALLAFVLSSAILIMSFGTYYLSRTVINPIKLLVDATRKFAEGNRSARANYTDETELGTLAEAFNAMADRIEENRLRLEDNLAELEDANKNLKRTQAELVFSEKLAGVGQLAQGVAHEIGNPLSAVLGYLEILSKRPSLGDFERDIIGRSENEIARINLIIRELLNYSRPAELEIVPVDLNEVVRALVTLVGAQKRMADVEVTVAESLDLPSVMCDRNRLLQVLVNLAFNAADAMPEGGGRIEVGAAKRKYQGPSSDNFAEGGDLSKPIEKGADVIELWVRDTGTGISPDNMKRLFDPFFTTKEPGRGTGLGLAVSSRILEQLHARMRIESNPGGGTECVIVFRVSEPAGN